MQKKILFLDGLRGIAAFYVLAHHARWLLWEGYSTGYVFHPDHYSFIDSLLMYFFSLFKWGHEAVIFFFVLSGFVIHLKYARALRANSKTFIGFKTYFYNRCKRIYPPLLLALSVTLILDMAGKAAGFTIYSGTTPYSLINSEITKGDHGALTFIGNLLFLYNEYVPVYGSNQPAWSLKFEWWFYVWYPVFLIMSRKNIYNSTGIVVFLFICALFPAVWPLPILRDIFSMMIYWWLGVVVAEIAAGRLRIGFLFFASLSVICMALLFSLGNVIHDLQVALFFSALLAILLWCDGNNVSLQFLNRLKLLGDFSYTLYIIHFPMLVFISGLVMKFNHNRLPMHSYFIPAGISLCLVLGYLFHFISETPFEHSNKGINRLRAER